MIVVYVIVALLVVALLWLVVTYNKLVRLRNEVDQGFSGIDVQLKRRADLIPNLVESVKAYAAHEGACSKRSPRPAPRRSPPDAVRAAADAPAPAPHGPLFAIAEAYPELRAGESFKRAAGRAVRHREQDRRRAPVLQQRWSALQHAHQRSHEPGRGRHRLHAARVLPHRGRRRPRAGRRQASARDTPGADPREPRPDVRRLARRSPRS